MTDTWDAERAAVPPALVENAKRRRLAAAEGEAARQELADLLARGTRVGFDTAELARLAGVSRETAHKLLRDAGVSTLQQMHRAAKEAGIPDGPARVAWVRGEVRTLVVTAMAAIDVRSGSFGVRLPKRNRIAVRVGRT